MLCARNGPAFYSRNVVTGYGHIDCIFGVHAADDVYPHILEHLEQTARL
jgi:cholesterol oxidase